MAPVMLAIAQSAVLSGISSNVVRVEVEAARGIPRFELVGLAETAVRESRVRVKSALATVGIDLSEIRMVVNLGPADLPKAGSAFDVAIAIATLVAIEELPAASIDGVMVFGELSLDGTLQNLRGAVAHLLGAKRAGFKRVVLPRANEREAALVDGIQVELASTLEELVHALRNGIPLPAPSQDEKILPNVCSEDLDEVRGQDIPRFALEVAAAGSHNLLMMGPPGSGKTMLARRLPGILPQLTREEAVEVFAIHGIAGLQRSTRRLYERPFRAPHHTVSEVALVGGGETVRPGEVSLAHNGVLFLDELSEFRRPTLESLRQPLEDGAVTISRIRATATFPSRPMVVGATNPCACGNNGDGTHRCSCTHEAVRVYRRRLSGPLLDRLDVHVNLPRVEVADLGSGARGESSAIVRGRVERVRAVQLERYRTKEVSMPLNAQLSRRDVEKVCRLDAKGKELLAAAVEQRGLSARAYGKVLRVARTIADIKGSTAITSEHVGAAIKMRVLDREQQSLDSNAA